MEYFVYGLGSNQEQIQKVIAALQHLGIEQQKISVLTASRQDTKTLAHETQTHAAHGGFAGGNIGAGIGWLTGLGTLFIPGIGLLIAAGPILGVLTGIAVGRSIGNVTGAMIEEMGIPDQSVETFYQAIQDGDIIISAMCEDEESVHSIMQVMRECELNNIDSSLHNKPDHSLPTRD